MKVLKNYKPTKDIFKPNNYQTFQVVKIIDSEDVFIDLPVVALEFGKEYTKVILYGNTNNGLPTAYDEQELMGILANLKLYHLKVTSNNDKDDEFVGNLMEVKPEEADIHISLPKDLDVKQLVYDNGTIGLLKNIPEQNNKN